MPVPNVNVREEHENLFRVLDVLEPWFDAGEEILRHLTLIFLTLGSWALFTLVFSWMDFILLPGLFGFLNYDCLTQFLTGSILSRIGVIAFLTFIVEMTDERTLHKWIKLTALCTIMEWIVFGILSYVSWTPTVLLLPVRIIYPVVSYSVLFGVYFYYNRIFKFLSTQ